MFGQFPFYNFGGNGANGGQRNDKKTPQGRPPMAATKAPMPVIDETYHDHLHDDIEDDEAFRRKNTGGVTNPFPEKLMEMLAEADPIYIGWLSHGRGFKIRDQKGFVDNVMQLHFKHTKITSFQRQLNLYGFRRLTRGPDTGAYFHEYFLRDMPRLCVRMRRQKIKGTGHKPHHDIEKEPDFYRMEPVGPMTKEQQQEFADIAGGTKLTEGGGASNDRGRGNSNGSMMSDDSGMLPPPPSLSQRLSGSFGGGRLTRTISTMLRRVSSLGSEGWDEQPPDSLDEEIAVDFDEIFKGDGSGDAGELGGTSSSHVKETAQNLINFSGNSTTSTQSMLINSTDGFQTSDRSMNDMGGSSGRRKI
ncbi:hypothetical protein TrVE_jg11776 [Triparma verrucosa]|uniref:HSF-type DNA-binding domain-containing protein n=1 Tax=Triparma verrucosa TaxID=1606542 RepID=A0A9W7C9W8_9STRA|nr:hypothetical protein TrVE_jg11776 [Triparma verrucosa]